MRTCLALVAALLLAAAAGCSDVDETPSAAPPGSPPSVGATDSALDSPAAPSSTAWPSAASSIYTLTPLPVPPTPPPSGELRAELRQSSRDSAADRFEVWVDNDTDATIRPVRITYRDPRYRTSLPATRLREVPSQSERGFQIHQPDRPACGSTATSGSVTVTYRTGGQTRETTIPVEDEAEVAGRYAASRCVELAVARVAELSWADDVPSSGEAGAVGTLTLQIRPTGRPGPTLSIDSIRGTPVLNSAEGDWVPDLTVRGTDAPQDVPLPVKPTRCDAHAFAESGGATAFAINLHVDGEPGQIILRMSPTGAAQAIDFGVSSCGSLLAR